MAAGMSCQSCPMMLDGLVAAGIAARLLCVPTIVVLALGLTLAARGDGPFAARLRDWAWGISWTVTYFVAANLETFTWARRDLFRWQILAWGPLLLVSVRLVWWIIRTRDEGRRWHRWRDLQRPSGRGGL